MKVDNLEDSLAISPFFQKANYRVLRSVESTSEWNIPWHFCWTRALLKTLLAAWSHTKLPGTSQTCQDSFSKICSLRIIPRTRSHLLTYVHMISSLAHMDCFRWQPSSGPITHNVSIDRGIRGIFQTKKKVFPMLCSPLATLTSLLKVRSLLIKVVWENKHTKGSEIQLIFPCGVSRQKTVRLHIQCSLTIFFQVFVV